MFGPGDIVAVLVGVAVEGPYSYRVPRDMEVQRGSIVSVPLGPRLTLGVVWGPPRDQVGHNRLRDIEFCYEVPPLSEELLKLVEWVARYTLAAPGQVLRGVLRSPEALDAPRPVIAYRRTGFEPEKLTPARLRVVLPPDPDAFPAKLNQEQQAALDQILSIDVNSFGVALLDGVTGGGKTEVFFEAVADTLRAGRQALILLPEIALTNTFIDRFTRRFGTRPAEWHSDMTPAQRAKIWRGVLDGTVRALVGARSALFLPFRELGLLVLDEEHDGAYKQSEGFTYHARDMAIVR